MGVEIPPIHLESKAADAAFALAGLWSKEPETAMNLDQQPSLQQEKEGQAEVFSWYEWEGEIRETRQENKAPALGFASGGLSPTGRQLILQSDGTCAVHPSGRVGQW